MFRLTAARHLLSVQRKKTVKGSAGQSELVDDGPPVSVRGNAHPLTAEEISYFGDRALETRRFLCRSWPADMNCVITFQDAQWDQVAPAQIFDIGRFTQHAEVIIRKR